MSQEERIANRRIALANNKPCCSTCSPNPPMLGLVLIDSYYCTVPSGIHKSFNTTRGEPNAGAADFFFCTVAHQDTSWKDRAPRFVWEELQHDFYRNATLPKRALRRGKSTCNQQTIAGYIYATQSKSCTQSAARAAAAIWTSRKRSSRWSQWPGRRNPGRGRGSPTPSLNITKHQTTNVSREDDKMSALACSGLLMPQ
eukprot:882503-Prorocentrum_minimum.AAC.1